jgi:hypothetical protein
MIHILSNSPSLLVKNIIDELLFNVIHNLKKSCHGCEDVEKYKELLMMRIDAEFCACHKKYNHKEEFMQDMEKGCGITIYY